MHKYTHISAFYQVARYIDQMTADPEVPERFKVRTPVRYRGSIKLHGANAGVQCTPEGLVAQSRTRAVTPQDDNYGFAAFVALDKTTTAIREIEERIRKSHDVDPAATLVLFGEWIGPGVQRGVAVTGLAQRQWALFAVRLISGDEGAYIDAVPALGDEFAEASIYSVMDGPIHELEVDFQDAESKAKALEMATSLTSEVEACCPWAKRFGLQGTGEGLVWVPVGDHWGNSDLYFKTKGDKHKVVKSKSGKPQLSPEVLKGVADFIEFALPDTRLRQGLEALQEMGHAFEMRSMPHYLKWVGQDVRRECEAELETNGLEWRTVSKAVTRTARSYFIAALSK